METTNRNNVYLAISFALGCFWGGVAVWVAPKLAIWIGMGTIILTYNVLRLFGNSADAS